MLPQKPFSTTPRNSRKQYRHSWRPFEEARTFARSLGLKSKKDWDAWAHSGACPADIPFSPNHVYADCGWASWSDWLGTRHRRRCWRPFAEARALVRALGLRSSTEWVVWAKSVARPVDIPCTPRRIYRQSGWTDWYDWLGTPRKCCARPFAEARTFARSLNLASSDAWKVWVQKSGVCPPDLPACPDVVYKNKGWVNWNDWLGCTGRRRHRSLASQW